MQPSQPYYQPPSNNGQYDFIMQPNQPGRPAMPLKGPKMWLIAIGGAVVVILLIWFIVGLMFGGKGETTAPLISIAQQQTEMVRIGKAATDGQLLQSSDAKNFNATAVATLTSDKKALVAQLAQEGTKVKDKTLAAGQSSTNDATLAAAKTSGTYDSTFLSTMQTLIKKYQASIQQAINQPSSQAVRTLLQKDQANADMLLQLSEQRS